MYKVYQIALIQILVTLTTCYEINDFRSLTNSLFEGNPVRFIAQYSKCSPSLGNAVGGNQIDNFEYFNDSQFGGEFLGLSGAKLISNYQGQGFVYDYVKQKINPNGTIAFLATDVYTSDFSPVYEETFVCQIEESVKFSLTRKEKPRLLNSYDELVKSLFNGEEVNFVNPIRDCPQYIGPFGQKAPRIVQGTSVRDFQHFNDAKFYPQEFVAFYDQKLIKNFLGKGFQYNVYEFKVWKNGTLHMKMNAINAADYSVIFSE